LRGAVERTPEIPASDGTPGTPVLSNQEHLGRFGKLVERVSPLHCDADSEVAGRKDVGPPEAKHKEHLSGPDADTLYLRETGYDFIVIQGRQVSEDKFPIFGEVGKIADIRSLGGGKSEFAERGRAHAEDGFRGDSAIRHAADEAIDKDFGDFRADLLGENATDQGAEVRVAVSHGEGADLLDDAGEDGVKAELFECLLHKFRETE
jgi:hypothetical protein